MRPDSNGRPLTAGPCEHVFDARQSNVSFIHMTDFVRNLLRPDAFRDFLIIGSVDPVQATPQFSQLYYSTFQASAIIPGVQRRQKSGAALAPDTTAF